MGAVGVRVYWHVSACRTCWLSRAHLFEKLGVTSTPTSFINGRILVGAPPAPDFYKIIDGALAEKTAGRKQPTEGGKQKAANTPH